MKHFEAFHKISVSPEKTCRSPHSEVGAPNILKGFFFPISFLQLDIFGDL